VCLSYARVELLFISVQGLSVECNNGTVSPFFCDFGLFWPFIWLPWQRALDPCHQKCLQLKPYLKPYLKTSRHCIGVSHWL